MLANWVKETVSAGGTGNLTLGGAPAGFVTFNDAFGLNERFLYVIEDGNNRETGFGYLSATDTLVREFIYDKLDGGVYSQDYKSGALSGINVTTSATVSVTSNKAILWPQVDAYDVQFAEAGASADSDRLIVVPSSRRTNATISGGPVSSRIHGAFHYQNAPRVPSKFIIRVSAAGASTDKVSFAFYRFPATATTSAVGPELYWNSETFTDLSVTGYNFFAPASPPLLVPGWYVACILIEHAGTVKVYHWYTAGSAYGAGISQPTNANLAAGTWMYTTTGSTWPASLGMDSVSRLNDSGHDPAFGWFY